MTQYVTPDLCDEYPDLITVVEPMFNNYGARESFGGEIVTVKCHEDNSKVKELVDTDEVGHEDMREVGADQQENNVFRGRAPCCGRPGGLAADAFASIEQPLDRAEDELHVDRLRAGPPAPDPAEQGGDEEDRQHRREHEQREQQRVGRAEAAAEDIEVPVDDIEQHGGAAVDLDVRQQGE